MTTHRVSSRYRNYRPRPVDVAGDNTNDRRRTPESSTPPTILLRRPAIDILQSWGVGAESSAGYLIMTLLPAFVVAQTLSFAGRHFDLPELRFLWACCAIFVPYFSANTRAEAFRKFLAVVGFYAMLLALGLAAGSPGERAISLIAALWLCAWLVDRMIHDVLRAASVDLCFPASERALVQHLWAARFSPGALRRLTTTERLAPLATGLCTYPRAFLLLAVAGFFHFVPVYPVLLMLLGLPAAAGVLFFLAPSRTTDIEELRAGLTFTLDQWLLHGADDTDDVPGVLQSHTGSHSSRLFLTHLAMVTLFATLTPWTIRPDFGPRLSDFCWSLLVHTVGSMTVVPVLGGALLTLLANQLLLPLYVER